MAVLYLNHETGKKGKAHYSLKINDVHIVYCYIRKNACSSFKRMFLDESPFSKNKNENALAFMEHHHRASNEDIANADFRVCVLRPPEDRIISVFKNKFIDRKGNQDIFASYERVVGQDPNYASFSDLVLKYLSNPLHDLDPHVHSQVAHLLPVKYNSIIFLNELFSGMVPLIGTEMAQKYFSQKMNATSTKPTYDENSSEIPAQELVMTYAMNGMMPSKKALIDPVLLKAIRVYYVCDYRVLRNGEGSEELSGVNL